MATEAKDPWVVAHEKVEPLGKLPSFFTRYIGALRRNHQKNIETGNTGLDAASRDILQRLIAGDTLRSIVYYAAQTYRPEKMSEGLYEKPKELLELFSPNDLASVIGVAFLYRRLQKLCHKDEWQKYNRTLLSSVEIGGHFGSSVTDIGFSKGLLVGAFPRLATAVFMLNDLSRFKEYRAELRERKLLFDFQREQELFSCTHAHIAARLMTLMGFGKNEAQDFYFGIFSDSISAKKLPRSSYAYHVANLWVNSLLIEGSAPDADLGDEFELSESKIDALLPKIEDIRKRDFATAWMEQLFHSDKGAAPEGGAADLGVSEEEQKSIFNDYGSLSESFQEQFDQSDYEKITSEIKPLPE